MGNVYVFPNTLQVSLKSIILIFLVTAILFAGRILPQWDCRAPTPTSGNWTSVDAPTFIWVPAQGNTIHCGYMIDCTLCDIQQWTCGSWCWSTNLLFRAPTEDSCYTLPNSTWLNGFVYDSNTITTFWWLSNTVWVNNHVCGGHIRRLPASLPPCSPILPPNGQLSVSVTPLLKWGLIDSATSYRLRIYGLKKLNNITFDSITTRDSLRVPSGKLTNNKTYWWRVKAYKTGGEGPFSDVWNFTTGNLGIKILSSVIPENFSLNQNFPNPFNPVTKLEFGIEKHCIVKLTIFDILGREVASLVNENLIPGTYEAEFDGTNYTSGVYFYKLETEFYIEVRKMVLIK